MNKTLFLLMFLLSVFLIPNLQAQGLNLGPQVGFQKADDAEDGNFLLGAALRLKFSKALGIEGSINYRQEDFGPNLTVRSWPVMVTGLLYPLPIVYGAVGAGWYNTTFDFDTAAADVDETKQEFGWHFGAGVELPLGSKTKLAGDIRYVFLDYDFDEIPFRDVDSNFFMISAGILFGL
ncbi:porin family protein [candidate division KSB1 bacterium]|nr:porin family protein [candidate division KSB1 bacterium]NIR72715.1 porin family protein [candidate division KSB1 bacterium]NIS26800.1 porin family protein [candidate division KSB1 bacterium]NIT73594.1 porin family protein [candidate division KSB1 bacterium]NIU27470.1 porin family protein [candidate division KSB1 bacterium]